MSNNSASDTSTSNIRNGVLSTAGLGSLMMGLTRYLDGSLQEVAALCVPVVSSLISFIGLYIYCRFMEPHALVSLRSGLKRDLKEQKSVIDDAYADDETKIQARKIYSATKMQLATLRQDYASGKYNIAPSINGSSQT
ncbi:hypothetical protein [Erwinia sp. QL-Z3]|uniref:hypothetical protein n=1 Tax=Erwinia sp. QL-Z3 TaxID=2547962 RepID=UPI001070D604|nr:hypothetical protein [Erwinia sp. QL-Z3]QBR52677.1 hypothetical protein E2F51_23115 [Erwinia sp. QL-Z3]